MFRPPYRVCLIASSLVVLGFALGGCVTQATVEASPPPQQAMAPIPAEPAPDAAVAPPPPPSKYGDKTDVALLLPQTGPNAALGLDMIDAAELAMSDLAGDGLVLTPKDTQGTSDGATEAARSAIAEGARLIIGPLTAAELEGVAPLARSANVAVLSFSNQARVAGDGVYVLGYLPQQETKRIALYAISTGITDFAVLAPSTAFGQLAAQSFKDAVAGAGGTVDQVQFYDPSTTDPRDIVQGMGNGDTPRFKAILLPEPSPERLKNFASMLQGAHMGAPDVRLVGTDTWDVGNLGAEPAMVGGWYAAPANEARASFEQRFKKTYGHAPKRLATLAYDAVGMAAVLQKSPGSAFDAEALTNPSGFAGADGIVRLKPDGTSERGLAVMQVERDHTTVLSPAPQSFQSVGQ